MFIKTILCKAILLEKRIYLDHGATTPIHPDVIKAMEPIFHTNFGNPSSLHTKGREARKLIDKSRKKIADFLKIKPEEIIFTGGGTESDNIAILGTARKLKQHGKHLITSNIEHPAVLNTFKHLVSEGFDITIVPVDNQGIIHAQDIKKAIRPDTILISIMYVNNEIGTIQPVEEIAELAEENGIIFHTDAVQAFGKIRIDLSKSKIHLLSSSAHKLYGPKGIGLLYMRNRGNHPKLGEYIEPTVFGGGHEFGYRPSTENVPGIVGFAKAVEIADVDMEIEGARQKDLRDDFIKWVIDNIPDSTLNGNPTQRLYNNINLSFKNIEGESLLMYLDGEGIEVSTGSACSSKSREPSHVLTAIGLKPSESNIFGSLRITLGRSTSKEYLEYTKLKLKEIVLKLRKLSPLES